MAVANSTSTSPRRLGPRVRAALPWASALVLVAGTIAFVVAMFGRGDDAAPAQNVAAPPAQIVKPPPANAGKRPLEQGVREAAGKFILTAVARRNLAEAWTVTHPELRGGLTLAQWKTGNIPVPPFPVATVDEARFKVDESYKNEVLLQVALIPKPGADQPATVFWLGLKAQGKGTNRRWLVNYFMPRWAPRVPSDDF